MSHGAKMGLDMVLERAAVRVAQPLEPANRIARVRLAASHERVERIAHGESRPPGTDSWSSVAHQKHPPGSGAGHSPIALDAQRGDGVCRGESGSGIAQTQVSQFN
jgi:hypothetical protein